MPNTSASGGYLNGAGNPAPLNDAGLQDFFHDLIAGITGIANENIRPRWLAEPLNIPNNGIDWVAFGVVSKSHLGQPFEEHFPISVAYPNGYNESRSHRLLEVKVTIYGPNAERTEALLSRGVYVAQNQESLELQNMALIGAGDSITIPEYLKEQWVQRVDLTLTFSQQLIFDFEVQNLLHSQPSLGNEHYNEIIYI
jgi:hypothetical protein